MAHRKLIFDRQDGSRVTVILNEENEVMKRHIQKVPVYARKNVKLKRGELTRIPIKIFGDEKETNNFKEMMFFYEGREGNHSTFDGVIDGDSEGVCIVGTVNDERTQDQINEDEIIGYIYSMNVIEAGDEIEEKSQWNDET